jgi:nucleotide-binding universal stress UspA family protein
MKTILVAIDFSKNAEHALEYALVYADKLHADIQLIWVDNILTDDSVIDSIDRETRKEKKIYMEGLLDRYQPQLKRGKISYFFRKGRVYQEIAKAAKQINADIIFAGTHGVSGYEQFWIGSNAYRIMTQAPCPLVTIKSDYKFKKAIKNILLPLDSSLETKQKLPFACELAKEFGAQIHLLLVYNSPISVIRKRVEQFGKEAEKCLTERKMDYVIEHLDASNVAASLLDYSSKNKIDLIMIMTDQGITTANKFLGPYAQQLINNSTIPVMSLRAKEFIEE